MIGRHLRRLRADCRGVTVVEFAFVAPVMLLLLLGLFELGHAAYVQSALQGAVQKAARDGTLETGSSQMTAIDAAVTEQVEPLIGAGATFQSRRLSYTEFSEVGTEERYVDAGTLNGRYDMGECFEDVNGNGHWDADLGRSGQGGAHDAVLYTMTVSYERLFPMPSMLGWSPTNSISASTVLRNQPWGDQQEPVFSVCP